MRYLPVLFALIGLIKADAGLLDRLQIIDNHSEPEVVASEELGVNFLGGCGTMRANVVDMNPVHVSLPKFKAGCGGIDYNMGAFHIASGQEMKDALKAILKKQRWLRVSVRNGNGYPISGSNRWKDPAICQ